MKVFTMFFMFKAPTFKNLGIPGAGGLHVAVLVGHGHGGRGAVAGPHLARRPDARVSVVGAAGGDIRHVGLVLTQHSSRNKVEVLIRASNKP